MNHSHTSLPASESVDPSTSAVAAIYVPTTGLSGNLVSHVGGNTVGAAAGSGGHSIPPAGTILLETPIARGDQLITSLALRKPDAGTLRGVKLADLLQMDVAALITLLPRITTPTLTVADAARLDPVDLVTIATQVGNFFLTKDQRESLPA